MATQHTLDIASFALGFTGGLTVMGLVWLYFDIKRVLNAPQKLVDEILASTNKDIYAKDQP